MIVLDEQLQGRDLEASISRWYRGSICFVSDLRANTVIKDEAIPELLRKQRQPTFVTINERDFWRKVDVDHRFCVVCIAWPDSKVGQIPALLRELLKHSELATKRARMGKVVRVSDAGVHYYRHVDKRIVRLVRQGRRRR